MTLLLSACAAEPEVPPDPVLVEKAQQVVDLAIQAHGSAALDGAIISYDYRGKHFTIQHSDGSFRYERSYKEAGRAIREVMNNDGVIKEVDERPVELSSREVYDLETQINSIVYFSLLPASLNDAAVQKAYLGEATLDGEVYDKVGVAFQQEGGGRDHQDRFVYWFHRERHTLAFLAYEFHVGRGGTRFREAYNVREIAGIRFADYHNYKSGAVGKQIERYDTVFGTDALEHVSDIVLENVEVARLGG